MNKDFAEYIGASEDYVQEAIRKQATNEDP